MMLKDPTPIKKQLDVRGANRPCAACNSKDFILEKVVGKIDLGSVSIYDTEAKQTIETYVVVCARCGLVRFHSSAVLKVGDKDDG